MLFLVSHDAPTPSDAPVVSFELVSPPSLSVTREEDRATPEETRALEERVAVAVAAREARMGSNEREEEGAKAEGEEVEKEQAREPEEDLVTTAGDKEDEEDEEEGGLPAVPALEDVTFALQTYITAGSDAAENVGGEAVEQRVAVLEYVSLSRRTAQDLGCITRTEHRTSPHTFCLCRYVRKDFTPLGPMSAQLRKQVNPRTFTPHFF
jgi:hypothetical protein